ncbi:hypothetical protein F4808DRAFT_272387 [Astrocystis sublimbata]|nr:hypothetical protein F4808DRAFT_272387 [Astrocystis sublimbata]
MSIYTDGSGIWCHPSKPASRDGRRCYRVVRGQSSWGVEAGGREVVRVVGWDPCIQILSLVRSRNWICVLRRAGYCCLVACLIAWEKADAKARAGSFVSFVMEREREMEMYGCRRIPYNATSLDAKTWMNNESDGARYVDLARRPRDDGGAEWYLVGFSNDMPPCAMHVQLITSCSMIQQCFDIF